MEYRNAIVCSFDTGFFLWIELLAVLWTLFRTSIFGSCPQVRYVTLQIRFISSNKWKFADTLNNYHYQTQIWQPISGSAFGQATQSTRLMQPFWDTKPANLWLGKRPSQPSQETQLKTVRKNNQQEYSIIGKLQANDIFKFMEWG